MSEHTKSSNLKKVYQTNALKKTASLHSFNEHLEQNVTMEACKESQPTVNLDVVDTMEEMPSNRQGETEITATQLPMIRPLVTEEEEKEEFTGITKTPTTYADQQFTSEAFTQGKLTKNTIHQEDRLPIKEVSDGAMAIQGITVKEIEEIKKEHLIQTLQSLQYM